MGTQVRSPKRGPSPQFSAHICCGQMARWINMPLGGRSQPKRYCVRWGPSSSRPPPKKKGAKPPVFSAHVYCGQTAEWITMPLGMEVGLEPVHIVLDGDRAPQRRGTDSHNFWPNSWMHQDTTWCGDRPRPRPHCGRWRPSSSSKKGAQPPNFRPMSVVAKWLDGSRCHLVRR